jgi:hypothetical protein
MSSVKFPDRLEVGGVLAALLPFVVTFSSSSTHTVNGRVVEESSTDYFAILAGIAAVGIGVMILAQLVPNTAENDRVKRLALMVGIIAVGAYQLLVRGFGVL